MYLLEYPEIKGPTTIGKHKDCIKLATIDLSVGRSGECVEIGSNKRNTGGTRKCSPIHVTKQLDHVSIDIIQKALKGSACDAKIHFLGNNEAYFMIELKDCMINQYQMSGHGDVPHEKFYLTFSSVHYRSTPPNTTPRSTMLNLMTGEC